MESFAPAARARTAPPLPMVAADGAQRMLAQWRGKLVLLNLWATWCGPCIRELPSIARLAERMKDEPFQAIALSIDFRGWEKIAPFLEDHAITGLTVLHDPRGRLSRALGIEGMPTTVLFDADGKELGRLTGPAEWDSDEAVRLVRFYLKSGGS